MRSLAQAGLEPHHIIQQARLRIVVVALAGERALHIRLLRQVRCARRRRRHVAKTAEVRHELFQQAYRRRRSIGGCCDRPLSLVEEPIDQRFVPRPAAGLHCLQLQPLDCLQRHGVRRQRVPALEDHDPVGRRQRAVEHAQLDVVEIFGAGGAEHDERQRLAWLAIRVAGARRDHARDHVLRAEGHLHRHARAARKAR